MKVPPEYESLEAFAEYLSDDERIEYTAKEFGELCSHILRNYDIELFEIRAWLGDNGFIKVVSLNKPEPRRKSVGVLEPPYCPFKGMDFSNQRHTYAPSSSVKIGDCIPYDKIEELMGDNIFMTYRHWAPKPVVYKISGTPTYNDDIKRK